MNLLPQLSPSEFVALLNATLEFAYPRVTITGELSNFKVSKNRWIYFDLKDEEASVHFFGTAYTLPTPLEDGMLLRVSGTPRLHPKYGFSVGIQNIELSGQGTIKKAFSLLKAKLQAEGLFDEGRKRFLPYPPESIGLITSSESAAYGDFIKVLDARYGGIKIELADVQVQGEPAATQIVKAIEWFNATGSPPEVLVIIRGGGSVDDLQTFSSEIVTRAIAASRIPTLVAIGHEVDVSLSELAADQRASTPSNAAELLVPDKVVIISRLRDVKTEMSRLVSVILQNERDGLREKFEELSLLVSDQIQAKREWLGQASKLLELVNPQQVIKRGYAVVRQSGKVLRSSHGVKAGQALDITLSDGHIGARVQ